MENIIINFDANVTELTKAIDILVKLGQVDEKTANEFKQANKAYVERTKVTAEATKSAENLGKKTEESAKKTSKAVADTSKNISAMDSVLKSVAQGIAGAFAVQKIIAFGEESVKAFQEAERNALLLKSAVSVNGGLQQDFEDLIAQSVELQKVTIFSDDAIQQAQTAALQFGLTKDQVKALIPVITDFASATGQDLQTALDGVIQGINGVGRGLKIYGVTIDENGTRQSRLAEITDQLTKKFDGQAKALGETASGAAAKYANQLDDLQEKIGEKLAPKIEGLKSFFLNLADAALDASEDIGSFIDALVKINPIISLLKGEDPLENIKSVFVNAEKDVKELTKTAIDENRKMVDAFKKGFQNLSTKDIVQQFETLQDLSKENNQKAQESVGVQKKLYQDLAKEQALQVVALSEIIMLRAKGVDTTDEETKALNKLLDVSKLTDVELNNLKKTLSGFNDIKALDASKVIDDELEKRAKERGKKKSDVEDKADKERLDALRQQIKKNEDEANKSLEIQLANLETAKQNEIALEERSAAEKLLIDKKYLEEKLKYYEDDPVMQAKIGAEIATVNAKINEQAISDKKDTDDAIIKQNNDKNQAILDADEAAAKKQKDYQKALYEGIVNAVKETVSLISEAMNNYYNAQTERIQKEKEDILKVYDEEIQANETKHDRNKIGDRDYEKKKEKLLDERKKAEERADKELRRIKHEQAVYNKALAIADAIINTAVAVTANLAVPIVAALIAVLGAAEVAVIASQPIPKYAKGVERITGKGTETSDEVHAMLSPGERIVKASTNRKYFPILSSIHNERIDPETLNQFAKMDSETLKMLVSTDKQLLKDLATMQPVFLKHIEHIKPIRFREDNLQQYRRVEITTVSHETSGIDEYGVARALDRGTHLKPATIKELAKEIGKEVKEKKSYSKSWR